MPEGYINQAQLGDTFTQHLNQTLVAGLLISEVTKTWGHMFWDS